MVAKRMEMEDALASQWPSQELCRLHRASSVCLSTRSSWAESSPDSQCDLSAIVLSVMMTAMTSCHRGVHLNHLQKSNRRNSTETNASVHITNPRPPYYN